MFGTNPSFDPRAMGRRTALMALLATVVLASMGLSGALLAQDRPLDGPRAQGIVGERYDGLAVIRQPAAAGGLESLVADINAKRQALYQRRAASEGVPATEIGKIYAKEIFRSAPSGTWFQQENGSWLQK